MRQTTNYREKGLDAVIVRALETLEQRVSLLESGKGTTRAQQSPSLPSPSGKPVVTLPAASDPIATGGVYASEQQIASTTPSPVSSVQGKTGSVSLNSGDIPEGSNKYYTQARARSDVLKRTSSSADPSVTELPNDGDACIHYNSTSTFIYLAFNRSGTIYKVQLT